MTKKYIYEAGVDPEGSSTKIIGLVGTNKSVLEVGCASGSQSKVLKQNGNHVTGLEIDKEAATEARKYCENVIVGDIGAMNLGEQFPNKQFDVVMFADVLEHLYNPQAVLKNVSSVLKNDGYVLASIPNIAHASIIMELVKGRFDYQKFGLLDDTHIRFFTKKTICQMFESAGYCISSIDRRSMAPRHTEFGTTPSCPEEQRLLDYILNNSPESETYQFIVKAYKSVGGKELGIILSDEKMELEKQLSEKNSTLRRLESELNWIKSRPYFRLLNAISGLLGRKQ